MVRGSRSAPRSSSRPSRAMTGPGCAPNRPVRPSASRASAPGGSDSGTRAGASTSSSGWESGPTPIPPGPGSRGTCWTRSGSARADRGRFRGAQPRVHPQADGRGRPATARGRTNRFLRARGEAGATRRTRSHVQPEPHPDAGPSRGNRPLPPMKTEAELDVRSLERDLARALDGEVRFGAGDRALYATDGSNYRQVPIGVVCPRSTDDVVAAVEVCRDHGAPIVNRGGGTSLAGQTCNVAVVIDSGKHLRRILELNQGQGFARVQPGVVLDDLRDRAEEFHPTLAPDPSTHEYCTLGGMIGNNSCGVHSVMGGLTADNVIELDVITSDGTRMTLRKPDGDEDLQRIIDAGGRRGEIHSRLRDLRDRYGDLVAER